MSISDSGITQLTTHPKKSSIVASSSYDNTISLINIKTKILIAKFNGFIHNLGVLDVQFKHDGAELVSCDGSQKICVWKLNTLELSLAIARSDSGRPTMNPLLTIDEPTKSTVHVHEHEVDSILYLFDDYIVSKSAANDVTCWKFGEKYEEDDQVNIATETPVIILDRVRLADAIACVHRTFFRMTLEPNRLILVFGAMHMGKFYTYDFGDPQFKKLKSHDFYGMNSVVRMFDFSPCGKYMIAGTSSREIILFSCND
jgi:WD40 repeat protein